jgi:hypothetical protein
MPDCEAAGVLLVHLNSLEKAGDSIYQNGKIARRPLFTAIDLGGAAYQFGSHQHQVADVLREAWAWLVNRNILVESDHGWFTVSRKAKSIDSLEAFQAAFLAPPVPQVNGDKAFIAEERLADLRRLNSSKFDFSKLIRLCEEINGCAAQKFYFATGALTRAILDHVPPVFGCRTFAEVANNYSGSRSFKDAMENLEKSARKIGDSYLHTQIRGAETLPVYQQVNCSSLVDLLLSEILRISR